MYKKNQKRLPVLSSLETKIPQNNRKFIFHTVILKKFKNQNKKHQKYGEICEKYKNSQKPA